MGRSWGRSCGEVLWGGPVGRSCGEVDALWLGFALSGICTNIYPDMISISGIFSFS